MAPKEVAVQDALQAPSDVAFLDPAGVPEPLRNAVRRPLALSCKEINMQNPSSFSPRPGAKIKSIAARSVVDGALEDSADGTFDTSDFWYKSLRLAKNEDVTGLEFLPVQTHLFPSIAAIARSAVWLASLFHPIPCPSMPNEMVTWIFFK